MVDRYLLRYFLAVIAEGNFSRAAAKCGVSQPTLSVGIAKLEQITGKTLFLRTNRRVELTADGVRMTEHAHRIEREFTLLEQINGPTMTRRTVRLGVLETVPAQWLEIAVRAAAEGAPEDRLEIVIGGERALLAQLDRNRLDVVVSIMRPARARYAERLFSEGYGLVMPPNHPLSTRQQVAPEEVADSAMIVRRHCEVLVQTSRHFTSHGVRPFMSARTISDDQAIALVRAGIGLTVMPEAYAGHGIAMVRLGGFDLVREIGLVYDRIPGERVESRAVSIVAEALAEARERTRTWPADSFT